MADPNVETAQVERACLTLSEVSIALRNSPFGCPGCEATYPTFAAVDAHMDETGHSFEEGSDG